MYGPLFETITTPVDRHPLFDELEAFDPRWQQHYRTTREAVFAAGPHAVELFRDWAAGAGKSTLAVQVIPDTLGAVERMQEAEANSALPYKMKCIGRVREKL